MEFTIAAEPHLVQVDVRNIAAIVTIDAFGDLLLVILRDFVEHDLCVGHLIVLQQLLCLVAVGAVAGTKDGCLFISDDLGETLRKCWLALWGEKCGPECLLLLTWLVFVCHL